MVELYVHGFSNQDFNCSDHSRGVAKIQKLGDQEVLDFNFYAHAHPGFWVTKDQLVSGKKVHVDMIGRQQQFELQVQ